MKKVHFDANKTIAWGSRHFWVRPALFFLGFPLECLVVYVNLESWFEPLLQNDHEPKVCSTVGLWSTVILIIFQIWTTFFFFLSVYFFFPLNVFKLGLDTSLENIFQWRMVWILSFIKKLTIIYFLMFCIWRNRHKLNHMKDLIFVYKLDIHLT